MPLPRARREIHDPELALALLTEISILTQEPCAAPAAQQDASLLVTDAPIVELGDQGNMQLTQVQCK